MDPRTTFPLTEAPSHGAGHAGACGCGEVDAGAPELDVRPIPHSIRHATVFGAWSAIQPGGSLRDDQVIAAADRLGMAMVFTGRRHFRH